jgi:ADP-heptose:LPS heptosyltransferase
MVEMAPNRIIAFCLPGIGDAVLFTPALARLRQAFPEAHITIVTMFSGTADLLATNPDVDDVRHFDFFRAGRFAGLRYIWKLRQEKFDAAIGELKQASNQNPYNLYRLALAYHAKGQFKESREYCKRAAAFNVLPLPNYAFPRSPPSASASLRCSWGSRSRRKTSPTW